MNTILKKSVLVLATLTLYLLPSMAQSPEKISYQAVIRNSNDQLITNTQIKVRVSILKNSVDGSKIYRENHFPITNSNGLISIEVGTGEIINGNFSTIDWSNDVYFIKTEIDPNGGTNYTINGVSQLLSVPYALHAKTAEAITGEITETDPVFTEWDKSTGISITESQISDMGTYIETEIDPVFSSWDKSEGILITESQVSDLGNYIESEVDPLFSSWDKDYNDLTNKPTNLSHFNNDAGYILTESQNLSDVLTQGNNANNNKITNLGDPIDAKDAVTKEYVDALLERIEALESFSFTFMDPRDGNVYKIVRIGSQVWMAENLKYLPEVSAANSLPSMGIRYYVYGYIGTDVEEAKATENYNTYGAMYNWNAAIGACPPGWHLPSDNEWKMLESFIGLPQDQLDLTGERGIKEGGKLKEKGILHWQAPNVYANDEYGFCALPGGFSATGGIKQIACWWTSTDDTEISFTRRLAYSHSRIIRYTAHKGSSFNVRCVRDY